MIRRLLVWTTLVVLVLQSFPRIREAVVHGASAFCEAVETAAEPQASPRHAAVAFGSAHEPTSDPRPRSLEEIRRDLERSLEEGRR